MKTYRIAIFLIVFSLGFAFSPQAYTLNIIDDTNAIVKKEKIVSSFRGVRISPTPLDEILFANVYTEKEISESTTELYSIKNETEEKKEVSFSAYSVACNANQVASGSDDKSKCQQTFH